jgi:hypothetical protein
MPGGSADRSGCVLARNMGVVAQSALRYRKGVANGHGYNLFKPHEFFIAGPSDRSRTPAPRAGHQIAASVGTVTYA